MELLKKLTATVWLPIGAAVVIMLISCVVQGRWSERWETFPELELFARQLDTVPLVIGEWQGKDEEKTEERIRKLAGNEGELMRTYRNASGQEVRVSLICARLQDIFFHTPDRCYQAAGFEMQSEPQLEVFEIGDKTAEFFTTTFLKSEPAGTHSERGYWSWSGDGTWVAPSNQRLRFAGQRALFKLYVFTAVPPGDKKNEQLEYVGDFMRAFIPALEIALRPALEEAGRVKKQESAAAPAGTAG